MMGVWKPRLDDLADSDAANGLDRIEHLLCGHAVAGQGLVIDADSEHRQPGYLLGRRVRSAGDCLDDLFDFLGLDLERLQIFAIELDAKVGR